MHFPRAMQLALAIADKPQMARAAQRLPLPEDTGALLEIAAGETTTIAELSASSGTDGARLQEAAGFFVEQILLSDTSDSYRVLGGTPSASSAELRRHMALLMRWLHPDIADHVKPRGALDRGVLANRVARAWDDLKTNERRAAYDATLSQRAAMKMSQRDPTGDRPSAESRGASTAGAAVERRVMGPIGLVSGMARPKTQRLASLRNRLSTWLRRP